MDTPVVKQILAVRGSRAAMHGQHRNAALIGGAGDAEAEQQLLVAIGQRPNVRWTADGRGFFVWGKRQVGPAEKVEHPIRAGRRIVRDGVLGKLADRHIERRRRRNSGQLEFRCGTNRQQRRAQQQRLRRRLIQISRQVSGQQTAVAIRIPRRAPVGIGEKHSRQARPRQQIIVVVRIHRNGCAGLLEFAGAVDLLGFFLCARQRRQQHGRENRDDGDDHEQFNQRKRPPVTGGYPG